MGIDYSLVQEEIQSESQNTLEKAKFLKDDDGYVRVRTTSIGSFSFSGLSTAQRNTTFNVSTTAIPLPATALTDRNSISIRNLDLTTTLYIGGSDVVANDNVGTTAGWQVGPNESYNVDITEGIVIYGVVASGTIKVQVRELA